MGFRLFRVTCDVGFRGGRRRREINQASISNVRGLNKVEFGFIGVSESCTKSFQNFQGIVSIYDGPRIPNNNLLIFFLRFEGLSLDRAIIHILIVGKLVNSYFLCGLDSVLKHFLGLIHAVNANGSGENDVLRVFFPSPSLDLNIRF